MPKKTIQHEIDQKACAILEELISYCARARHGQPEYGIDFTFEFFEDFKGKTADISGLDFCVQCKGKSKSPHRSDYVSFPFETDKIAYYLDKKRRPVFLVVVDITNRIAYWEFIQRFAKNLKSDSWRKQKTITVRIPLLQRIDQRADFRAAVAEADEFMRDLWPGSVSSAIDAEKARIESADPRVKVDISATSHGVHVTLHPKEDIRGSLSITGPTKNVKRAIRDGLDRGLPIDAKEYGVAIAASGLPGQPPNADITSLVTRKTLQASTRIALIDQNGMLKGAIDLEGKIEAGLKESRFFAESASQVFAVSARWRHAKELTRVKATYKFNLKRWFKKPVWRLPDFDRIHAAFGTMVRTDMLEISLFIEGNLLTSARDPVEENQSLMVLPDFTYWLKRLRDISSQTATELQVKKPLSHRNLAEIDYCYRFLMGEKVSVGISEASFTTRSTTGELESMKKRFAETQKDVRLSHESFFCDLLGDKVDVGPAVFESDEARIELKNAAPFRKSEPIVEAKWRLVPITPWHARRISKADGTIAIGHNGT